MDQNVSRYTTEALHELVVGVGMAKYYESKLESSANNFDFDAWNEAKNVR